MLCVIDVVSGLNSEKIWAGRLGYPSDFLGCLFWERQRWTKKKKKKKEREERSQLKKKKRKESNPSSMSNPVQVLVSSPKNIKISTKVQRTKMKTP
jgi:hypothetical protein